MRRIFFRLVLFTTACLLYSTTSMGQKRAVETDRLLYSPTAQTLPQGVLALRASLRFGDMGGDRGGYENFYGLDQLNDSYFGLNYGVTDRIQLGVSRTRGSGVQRQLVNGEIQLHILKQSDSTGRIPVNIVFSHITTGSFQLASRDPESLTYFGDMAHRFSYASQLIVSRKYSSHLTLQALGGYQHRNMAPPEDDNGLFYAGLGAKISFSDRWSFLMDGLYPISDTRTRDLGYFPLLGVGLSYERPCGDRWVLEFTNASGLIENDFIPYSTADISKGEIRLGLSFIKPFFTGGKEAE